MVETGTPETLPHIQKVIRETVAPSWLNSVQKNYGDAKAGSIKVDEWQTLNSVFLPIALITLWDDVSESGLLLKALHHTMALFQATIIACRYTTTAPRVQAFREYIDLWVQHLWTLIPGVARPNIHAIGHIYDFLLLFGPVLSWWCFPFERLIRVVQKINTNSHIGGRYSYSPKSQAYNCNVGVMESTMIERQTSAAG
ncbi:hypothetical protein BDP27DRAFT_1244376 [Rhodocollybia butyracea]|uniref:Uncharacterized protein n=1 Tax=Rhodocollybia butyracea TaxID=206335 RepID=A0A9P5P5G2_9AGAR|nr:hypothetical protein BDP27DRAFT_1244376 [Rhodocollybia butyracea]